MQVKETSDDTRIANLHAVQVLRPAMPHRRHELAVRHQAAGELVGDDHPGHVPQALEQSAEELLCGHRVSARLDQNVEHVAVLVDRAPQVESTDLP
jgi:hypothetical protein